MSGMELYFNIISLAAGFYCLYSWGRLFREKKLFQDQLFIPKDARPEDCLDEAGYIAFIRPWIFAQGLTLFLSGGLCLLNDWIEFVENTSLFNQIANLFCIAAVVSYIIVWTVARKRYW